MKLEVSQAKESQPEEIWVCSVRLGRGIVIAGATYEYLIQIESGSPNPDDSNIVNQEQIDIWRERFLTHVERHIDELFKTRDFYKYIVYTTNSASDESVIAFLKKQVDDSLLT